MMVGAKGVEGAEGRPCSIDIIHAPSPEPTPIRLLLREETGERLLHGDICFWSLTQLAQHRHTTRSQIRSWRIEQGPVVGEGDMVKIVLVIVHIKGRPAAIAALQSLQPVAGP